MKDAHLLEPRSTRPDGDAVYAAWERFARGEDHIRGVRPEVAISWYRCRELYRVDPHLREAPAADAHLDHTPEHEVVFTVLGGLAVCAAQELAELTAMVTVTDSGGRMLGAWGDQTTLARAAEANMAPWSCWSERAAGTNGMGTALESRGPVLIRGAEHWCQAFHHWVCAGIAVRDVVTDEPIAVLNISCWSAPLPEATGRWLSAALTKTRAVLKAHARDSAAELAAAFSQATSCSGAALAAVDTAGRVVIADDRASALMGVPAHSPAVDPDMRWESGLPELVGAARQASMRAGHDPDWVGSIRIFTHLDEEPTPITIRPVFSSGHLAGHLISLGDSDGAQLPQTAVPAHPPAQPRRLVAVRDNRIMLLRLREVCYAESEGNDVWLATDHGRLHAATHGLEKLAAELADNGFLRVHRRYLVNVSRIREIERGARGALLLVMDGPTSDTVPVSRRSAPVVRRALGI